MRFLHLSDLHIGLKLINHDLLADQEYILKEIVRIVAERQPDAVVIAGDIYDKSIPSAEAVALFDGFVTDLVKELPKAEIMMISGNHDNASRINIYRNILQLERIHMIGMPPRTLEEHIEKVTMQDEYGNVNFYLLPFVNPSMIKGIVGVGEDGRNLSYDDAVHKLLAREDINPAERNVLVSHQFYLPAGKKAEDVERMDSETVTVGNIDSISADVLESFDYAALGHIHKPMQVGSPNYRYCGTPIPCSVSEAGQQKGIIEVTLGARKAAPVRAEEVPAEDQDHARQQEESCVQTEVIPLTPLHQIRVVKGSLAEVLASPSDDYVSIVLTDKADLDVIDMQDRLRHAFPNLLEIRRENVRRSNYDWSYDAAEELSPLELCLRFLDDTRVEKKHRGNRADAVESADDGRNNDISLSDSDREPEQADSDGYSADPDAIEDSDNGTSVQRVERAILADVINTVLGGGMSSNMAPEGDAKKAAGVTAGTAARSAAAPGPEYSDDTAEKEDQE